MDMETQGKPWKINENTPKNQHFPNSVLRVKNASFAISFEGNALFSKNVGWEIFFGTRSRQICTFFAGWPRGKSEIFAREARVK